MGRPNPIFPYSQLYIRNEDQELCQLRKLNPGKFEFKDGTKISRQKIFSDYTFYGVIDRFGFVIKYQKVGRQWCRDKLTASYSSETGLWKSVVQTEETIIKKLNEMNADNPELSFVDPFVSSSNFDQLKERRNLLCRPDNSYQENFQEV